MANIIIGEMVINKAGNTGTIISFENGIIHVDFKIRIAKFKEDAFENGYLRYENTTLQSTIEEGLAQLKFEEERLAEEKRFAVEKTREDHKKIQAELSSTHFRINVLSASIRLDSAPITFNSVRKNDVDLIQRIFAECDKDTNELYSAITPEMKYLRGEANSKYAVAFMTRYLDTYVFRVFSRNDKYTKDFHTDAVTVKSSDTTEVFRFLCINGKLYSFSKNLSYGGEYLVNSKSHKSWHPSKLSGKLLLNRVIKCCDCGYLDNYIMEENIDCLQYVNLLFPAFCNNKIEILFKNKMFASAFRIEDLSSYLEEYSAKQIEFASKNNVLNTLPVIKRHGYLDLDTLRSMEAMMKKRKNGESTYSALLGHFSRLGFDCPDLIKKLLGFLKKTDYFDSSIYHDYIGLLGLRNDVTLRDFFDKNYISRHDIMVAEMGTRYTLRESEAYCAVARELSWIDREENDYYIILPKSISEFKTEGMAQHNCVFTFRYYRYVINRSSIVVFLRKEPSTPYVTIEFDYETFEILQAYGKYNSKISPDLYRYIVDLGQRLRCEMLSQQ